MRLRSRWRRRDTHELELRQRITGARRKPKLTYEAHGDETQASKSTQLRSEMPMYFPRAQPTLAMYGTTKENEDASAEEGSRRRPNEGHHAYVLRSGDRSICPSGWLNHWKKGAKGGRGMEGTQLGKPHENTSAQTTAITHRTNGTEGWREESGRKERKEKKSRKKKEQ